jgi:hypothetical protein
MYFAVYNARGLIKCWSVELQLQGCLLQFPAQAMKGVGVKVSFHDLNEEEATSHAVQA